MTRPWHPWWVIPRPRPAARARILCVPHAGSGSSPYVSWGRRLPEEIELRIVAPPGREHRADETPVRDFGRYVNGLVDALLNEPDIPWVLFGHSFGALVCYEMALRLTEAGRAPAHVILSARPFPTDLPAHRPAHLLPDQDLIAVIRERYGGFSAKVEEFPELLADVLASLRIDLAMMETFQPRFKPLLHVPVTVFWSPDDRSSTEGAIRDWTRASTEAVRFEAFPGGHFYLFERSDEVIARLAQTARSAASAEL